MVECLTRTSYLILDEHILLAVASSFSLLQSSEHGLADNFSRKSKVAISPRKVALLSSGTWRHLYFRSGNLYHSVTIQSRNSEQIVLHRFRENASILFIFSLHSTATATAWWSNKLFFRSTPNFFMHSRTFWMLFQVLSKKSLKMIMH